MSFPAITPARARRFWLKYGHYMPSLLLLVAVLTIICVLTSIHAPGTVYVAYALSIIAFFEYLIVIRRIAKKRQLRIGPFVDAQADLDRLDTATTLEELRKVVGLKEP